MPMPWPFPNSGPREVYPVPLHVRVGESASTPLPSPPVAAVKAVAR